MTHIHRTIGAVLLLAAAGCATTPGAEARPDPAEPAPPPAPWSGVPLLRSDVPDVYAAEWSRAENRERCALLAPRSLGDWTAATPRAAQFSGGWAVAYDLPDLRSAFGVAGTGVSASEPSYDRWPHRIAWADGSSAGYGPEGGSGPKQLAYLRVDGQDCLYNVWSMLGREHLETLMSQLRFVR